MAKSGFDFAEWTKQNSPFPPGESAVFQDFIGRFSWWVMLLPVFFAYGLCYLFGGRLLELKGFLPLFEDRYAFLISKDPMSAKAFVATVLSIILLSPYFFAHWAIAYWRKVVVAGNCMPVTPEVIGVMIFMACTSAAFFHITLVSIPGAYDPRWPGMSRILFWPIFPVFGGFITFIICGTLLACVVGTLKLIYMRELK